MGLLVTNNRYENLMDDDTFNLRFYYYLNKDSTKANARGYGPGKPFIPPLQHPQTLLGIMERHDLLLQSFWTEYNPFLNWNKINSYVLKQLGFTFAVPEDTWFDYKRAEAYGNHVYPTGIHKYYDLYSLDGYWAYLSDWLLTLVMKVSMDSLFFIFPLVWPWN